MVMIVLALMIATGTGYGGVKAKRADPLATVQAIQTQQAGGDVGAKDAEDAPGDLDARIGGTRESWEAEYDDPISTGDPSGPAIEYDLPGFSSVLVDFYEDRVVSISLFAPRSAGEEWVADVPSDTDWSVSKAEGIARGFLPGDVDLESSRDEAGYVGRTGASDSLADEVPDSVYEFVDNTPVYGLVSYALFLNGEERVNAIAIDLVVDESITIPQAAESTDDSAASDEAQGSAAEQVYIRGINEQTDALSESIDVFVELSADPQIEDETWRIRMAAVFVVWRASYQEALTTPVPPAFEEFNVVWIEALGYLDSASYDFATGIDTGDPSLIFQASDSIRTGTQRLTEGLDILLRLKEERGL